MLERRAFAGGVAAIVSSRLEEAGFMTGFAERTGGCSDGPFASLNLGLKAGDHIDNARDNRRRLCSAIGVRAFAVGRQVHGTRVARVGTRHAGSGFTDPAGAFPETDVLTAHASGVAIGVLTADCVPVALAEPRSGRLVVAHAGWRGVAAGVVAVAVGLFGDPSRVLAGVGPSIGPDHYEVGEDVARAVGAAAEGGAIVRGLGPRVQLDLPGTVVRILRERGVRSNHIEHDGSCTACEPERFFSYRRDGLTGRQGLVAFRL